MGCIFAELAYMWDKEDNDANNRFMFAGTSCYPLSPMDKPDQKSDSISDSM